MDSGAHQLTSCDSEPWAAVTTCDLMTREEFFERLGHLRTHKYRGKRAPNKPLLLLLALGRVAQGHGRLVSYREVERHLGALLRRFGPPRKRVHPETPFGRLRPWLWEIPGDSALSTTSKGDLLAGELKELNVKGGFPKGLQKLLEADLDLVSQGVQFLLNEHFPFSLHDEIRQATGASGALVELRLRPFAGRRKVREVLRRDRDPAFRIEVLREYEEHCAICDFEIRLDGELLGLEAAHIQWHSHDGPDRVPNGLALCMLHHKALDRGALGLAPSRNGFQVLISSQVSGRSPSTRLLIDVAGKTLRPPRSPALNPGPRYVAWHRDEVFRDPPLAT